MTIPAIGTTILFHRETIEKAGDVLWLFFSIRPKAGLFKRAEAALRMCKVRVPFYRVGVQGMKQQIPLFCISITHKQAPVEVRRAFAFDEGAHRVFLHQVIGCGASGAVLVSTCNRVEAYISGGMEQLGSVELAFSKGIQEQCRTLRRYCREYHGADAVKHLFRVCAGLDSMVIGEDEILGQIREAYKYTEEEQTADFYINTIFQHAIECAKRVKTDTCLSRSSVSIATLTASEITHFSDTAKNVLLIGITGQMGGLIARDLAGQKGIRIYATMRQHSLAGAPEWTMGDTQLSKAGKRTSSGEALQKPAANMHLISYENRYAYLEQADIVVSATKSPHYTLTYDACKKNMHTDKHRLFLDIAVPNDIDPDISLLPGTELKGIDHFQSIARENNERKAEGVVQAKDIIDEHLNETMKALEFHGFLPKLPALTAAMEQLSAKQLFFALKEAATDEELAALLRMSGRLLEENT